MRKARALVGFLVGLVALGRSSAPACPLRTPVWDVIEQAELIALARVEAFEPGDKTLESDVAILKILETWKGSVRGEVRVHFSGVLFAGGRPAVAGDRILVFLESGETQIRRRQEAELAVDEQRTAEWTADGMESGEDSEDSEPVSSEEFSPAQDSDRLWETTRIGRWFLAGSGNGVLVPDARNTKPLRDLVDQAVRLQEGSPVPDDLRREWLVQAAAVRETRQEAMTDLRILLAASGQESEGSASSQERLSASEQGAIAASFVRDPGADAAAVPSLMSLLSGFEDEAFDRALVSVIAAGVAAPRIPGWVPEAVRQLVVRRGWRDWGTAIWQRSADDGTLKEMWPAVARDLKLPAVAPARLSPDD